MAANPEPEPPPQPEHAPDRLRRAIPWILAGGGGALTISSFPGGLAIIPALFGHPVGAGYQTWPLAFFSMVPLLAAFEGATPRQAVAYGCFSGLVANAAGFYWLVGTIHDFGDLPWWLALLAWLMMSAANGLGWGVFGWIMRTARRDADGRAPWWLGPFAFTAVEFAWWSVFPAYFGAGLWKAPVLAQGAELTGIFGCSFLLLLVNAALYDGLRATRRLPNDWRRSVPVAAVVLALWTAFGEARLASVDAAIASAPMLKIGMAQSNIGAFTKRKAGQGDFEAAKEETTVYQQMSQTLEAEHVQLVVWPETAYPFLLPLGSRSASDAVGQLHTPAVIGAVTAQPRRAQHNSAILVDASGAILGESHKIQMVPFGEYLPFGLGDHFPKLYDLIPAISHLQPGDAPLPLVLPDGPQTWRFGSLICYEDILPGYTRQVVRATDPDIILNLTNDSWYGDSTEPTIHLALATFRAIENRRSLVRSTNTGRSALVDPAGRVVLESLQFTREPLVGSLPVLRGVNTLYRTLGGWLGWLSLAVALGLAGTRWRARPHGG